MAEPPAPPPLSLEELQAHLLEIAVALHRTSHHVAVLEALILRAPSRDLLSLLRIVAEHRKVLEAQGVASERVDRLLQAELEAVDGVATRIAALLKPG